MIAKPAYSPKLAVATLFLFTMTVALMPVVYNGSSTDWTGNILIEQPGNYQFALISDDGSLLEIDGRMVVDATSVLLQKQTGAIQLTSGFHSIHVKYFNTLFGGSVRLFWTPPARPEQIVPAEVLRPGSN